MKTRSEAKREKEQAAKLPSVIDDISAPLDDALKAKMFDKAMAVGAVGGIIDRPGAPGPKLATGFAAIVERVFQVDALADYNRLEAALTVGEQRADYHTVLKALDQAEGNARDAYRLYVASRIECERYDLDAEVVQAAMWDEASRELQAEKDKGTRSKQITDADVRAKASELHPDEWRSIQERRVRAKGMRDNLERLAELWVSRCRSLNAMLSNLRK